MTTTKLNITEMTASQSQKHVTFNEALFTLDNLVQLSVIDKDLSAPPVSPAVGDTYIVGGGASGSWLGKENNVASYDGDGWIFFPPNDGWFCWVDDENELYFYDGGWSTLGSVVGAAYLPLVGGTMTGDLALEEASPSIRFGDTDINGDTLLQTSGVNFQISVDYNNVDANSTFQVLIDNSTELEVNEYGLGVGGSSADANNVMAVYGTNALFNSGSSFNFKFNKNAAANDASLTFQTGFSTRALIGTLANDDLTFKVSPDGATFYTALTVDKDNGWVGIGNVPAPDTPLQVSGNGILGYFSRSAAGAGTNRLASAGYCWQGLVVGSSDSINKYSAVGIAGFRSSALLGRVSFHSWDQDDSLINTRGAEIVSYPENTTTTDKGAGLTFWTRTGTAAVTERFRIAPTGAAHFPGIGTTASAANAFLSAGATPANQLLRSTSSMRYKTQVERVDKRYSEALMSVSPIWYRSLAEADNPDWGFWGFAAEEVAAVDPRMVSWGYQDEDYELVIDDETGQSHHVVRDGAELAPDGVAYDRFVVHHHVLIEDILERLEKLESKS